jgi:ssRNA-specific RNase YbeY (16S rRNA maturation enzyme)
MTRKSDDIIIEVAVLSDRWPPYKARIKKVADKTLTVSGFLKKKKMRPIEISVALADDEFIRSLNFRFRGKDKATNVLSFINQARTKIRSPLVTSFWLMRRLKRKPKNKRRNSNITRCT